jgi:hypothetical protein
MSKNEPSFGYRIRKIEVKLQVEVVLVLVQSASSDVPLFFVDASEDRLDTHRSGKVSTACYLPSDAHRRDFGGLPR